MLRIEDVEQGQRPSRVAPRIVVPRRGDVPLREEAVEHDGAIAERAGFGLGRLEARECPGRRLASSCKSFSTFVAHGGPDAQSEGPGVR